jgi:rare lipoprotein A (peptidoglycan hydrolase)
MKPLIAALIFGLFFLSPCFAQTQTGNASYNASKNGLTLAHSSLSFGTRVRITNLRNNREVIAVVDGRIPVSDPRIADISAEAGGAIGMPASGYTQVRLEILLPPPPETASVAVSPVAAPAVVVPPSIPAAEPPAPAPAPIPPAEPPAPAPAAPIPAVVAPVPVPVEVPRSQEAAAAVPQRSSAPAVPASSSSDQEARLVESIQVITPQSQYAAPAAIVQSCFSSPLCYVILILLIIAVLLLTAILVLLLRMRPLPWRLWFYPLWVRRRLRYLKKRRF